MSKSSSRATAPRDAKLQRELERDLTRFATVLTIRPKSGALARLILNRAQQFIHRRLDAQQRETGRVRALILKGRQQGCSTYVAARFYHRAIHAKGVRVFILTPSIAAVRPTLPTAARAGLFARLAAAHGRQARGPREFS